MEIFCFDKTGTLTEDGLDVKGIRPSSITARDLVESSSEKSYFLEESDIPECASVELVKVLTSCHALALLGDSLIGDSLEVKMFEATSNIFFNLIFFFKTGKAKGILIKLSIRLDFKGN